jgi:hypothetical protein
MKVSITESRASVGVFITENCLVTNELFKVLLIDARTIIDKEKATVYACSPWALLPPDSMDVYSLLASHSNR